jgi:hypothetical protein
MKNRNPFAVFFLPFVTFGIYSIVWMVKTKDEMNQRGAQIPTAWLIIVPIVNYWWIWKYSEGVELVTNSKLSTPLAFVLQLLLSNIGMAVIQSEFNKVGESASAIQQPSGFTPQPVAPVTQPQDVSPTPPSAPIVQN